MMERPFEDKIAIVTAAADGLGAATCGKPISVACDVGTSEAIATTVASLASDEAKSVTRATLATDSVVAKL